MHAVIAESRARAKTLRRYAGRVSCEGGHSAASPIEVEGALRRSFARPGADCRSPA